MFYLAEVLPGLRKVKLPLTRDQLFMLLAAVNLFFLGVDTYLAHSISGTIRPYEWIPIIFGPVAGALLLIAGLIALRQRPLASIIATITLIVSIGVGLLGSYFHIMRAFLPDAPAGQQVTVSLAVWAPPLLGPLTFALVGWLGLSAVWVEDPADSGTLTLIRGMRLTLPYSKTRAYLFIVGLGGLATVISAVMDHARTGFYNPWLWVPTAAGVLGTVIPIGLAALDAPRRADIAVHVGTMLLLMLTGVVGAYLHSITNLSGGAVLTERFIRGAPFLAPLLFANMGMLGLVAVLDPAETH